MNRRVDLYAIDATPARWLGDVGTSPLDGASAVASSPRHDLVKNYRMHPAHWLISIQVSDGELKMWARVVNHGGMLLEDGQIIADTEGYLETVEQSRWSVPGRRTTA